MFRDKRTVCHQGTEYLHITAIWPWCSGLIIMGIYQIMVEKNITQISLLWTSSIVHLKFLTSLKNHNILKDDLPLSSLTGRDTYSVLFPICIAWSTGTNAVGVSLYAWWWRKIHPLKCCDFLRLFKNCEQTMDEVQKQKYNPLNVEPAAVTAWHSSGKWTSGKWVHHNTTEPLHASRWVPNYVRFSVQYYCQKH